jgi:hypothetical protein
MPVGQFSLGRPAGSDLDDQAVQAMDENVMGIVPALVFGSLPVTLVAIPLLLHPVVAMEKGFDRIAEFQIQKQTRSLTGLDLPLSGGTANRTGKHRSDRIEHAHDPPPSFDRTGSSAVMTLFRDDRTDRSATNK